MERTPDNPKPVVRRPTPPVLLLYLLLLAAAAATLTGIPVFEQAVRDGRRPPSVLLAAPILLAVFIALFAVYRFARVRAGHYHAGKAFVQVVFMVLVLAMLLPTSLERYRAATGGRPIDLIRQLESPDPEARALAAELARHRERDDVVRYLPRLVALLDDQSPEVRRQARASLVSIAGRDEGGEGAAAAARWRTYWRSKGVVMP
jgi:hypothetical protein